MSDQEPSEALLFRGFDSRDKNALGVPYCSFPNETDVLREECRSSIEVRAIAFFDD